MLNRATRVSIESSDLYVAKKKFHIRKSVQISTNLILIIYTDGIISLVLIYESFGISASTVTLKTLIKIIHEQIQRRNNLITIIVWNKGEDLASNGWK